VSSGGKDEAKTFNSFTMKDVIDDYPSEWDFLKEQIVDKKALATRDIDHQAVMKFINQVAGAIHRLDPQAKVSSGAHSMPYNTDTKMVLHGFPTAPFNYYSDQALIAAGGDQEGVMDFYQVHGYPEWNDAQQDAKINMFLNAKAHWGLDKPLVVGEHWNIVEANNVMLKPDHYQKLYDNGYAGSWGWAYFYVRETFDQATKSWQRHIDKHENQDYFRNFFQSLPTHLRQPVSSGL
jgi:endo-1,4-beta-mannosidase